MIKKMKIIRILVLFSCFLWACAGVSPKEAPISGLEIYKSRCVTCHGTDGKMGMNGAKNLPSSPLDVTQRIEVVTHGRNIMPGFKALMSEEEIKAVVEFTMTLK